jgi:phage shock protein A
VPAPHDPTPEPIDAEIVPDPTPPVPPAPDYDEHGVPTLDYVREKIERRYATSIGAAELAEGTAAARSVEEQEADRAAAAKAKLEELRRSLG